MLAESENNFTIEGSTDNPLNLGGRNPRNHYTVQKPWYRGTTYGGIHENIWAAINRQLEMVLKNLENNNGVPQASDSQVVYLNQGEGYVPWGSADTYLIHGVNDGFHGSSLLVPNPQLIDVVRNRLLQG